METYKKTKLQPHDFVDSRALFAKELELDITFASKSKLSHGFGAAGDTVLLEESFSKFPKHILLIKIPHCFCFCKNSWGVN